MRHPTTWHSLGQLYILPSSALCPPHGLANSHNPDRHTTPVAAGCDEQAPKEAEALDEHGMAKNRVER